MTGSGGFLVVVGTTTTTLTSPPAPPLPHQPLPLQDGIDYAATTIQSNYERIPFLFTVKDLVAKASSGGNSIKPGFQMGGGFRTPSYRTGLFLDPKGRGGSTGYDMAVALPGLQSGVEGDAEMFKENNKVFDVTDGNIEFEVNRVDKEAGEIGGGLCFVSLLYRALSCVCVVSGLFGQRILQG